MGVFYDFKDLLYNLDELILVHKVLLCQPKGNPWHFTSGKMIIARFAINLTSCTLISKL